MNSSFAFLPIIIILLFIINMNRNKIEKTIQPRIRRKKVDTEMQELAKRFIGKDVYVKTVSQGAVDGILKQVSDNAVVLEKDGKEIIVNLDYVVKLREYPTNKKGKRKSIFVD